MSLIILWVKGVFAHRSGRLLGAMAGVALTVFLLSSIGAFIASSTASMTKRAVANVPVDWQVQFPPGTDATAVKAAVGKTTAYTALERVDFADAAGFSANTGGTVQTTGPGKVLGISPGYRALFPAEVRQLVGSSSGVLIAQQTAANLHAGVGDTVTVNRIGLPPVKVKVAGVVDLPNADSLFQAVGLPPTAAPQAPPDNVLLLPAEQWHRLFDLQAKVRPDSVRTQFHVRIEHNLPTAPDAAYTFVQHLANNLEARIAGSSMVGNNLAARLASVRVDALYAKVLFLFLGLPGLILATLLTLAVTAAGTKRRGREQALLRTRGASAAQILKLEATEALMVGIGGLLLGLVLTYTCGRILVPVGTLTDTALIPWTVGAALVGLVLALAAVLYPAWVQVRHLTVMAARSEVGHPVKPLWQRVYLDAVLLAVSAAEFWRIASTGYQIVLAPEGVPATSVHYEAFIAPFCLWIGGVLLAMRLTGGCLGRGRRMVSWIIRPFAGGLAGAVTATLSRQRTLVTRGVVLVALAVSFAVSTAVFNTTYNAQSRVDAELTNGSDVTVTGTTASPPSEKLAALKALPGVAAAEPMQHRLAYVGNDLQDIYGIDPLYIGKVTNISNAYFANGNARETLAALAKQPDGVLVSEETVRDFQLRPGDHLNLRLQSARDHQYHVVPFHFIGVVREFPTAPTDSFLVANARYIARQTGTGAAETILMRAAGSPSDLAARARKAVSSLPGARVTDIGATQRTISSSLTAVDLHGLTRLELIFAVLLVAGSTGLILVLGLAERRRLFAILVALGARGNQLGAFLWSEGLFILVGGSAIGITLGFGIAQMLVKVLTGVFDPPPDSLSVPWGYLTLLAVAAVASTVVAILGAKAMSHRPVVEELRNL